MILVSASNLYFLYLLSLCGCSQSHLYNGCLVLVCYIRLPFTDIQLQSVSGQEAAHAASTMIDYELNSFIRALLCCKNNLRDFFPSLGNYLLVTFIQE